MSTRPKFTADNHKTDTIKYLVQYLKLELRILTINLAINR